MTTQEIKDEILAKIQASRVDRIQELPITRASGAEKAINTEGTTFEQQADGQQYRGGRLEVVYLTKTDRKE